MWDLEKNYSKEEEQSLRPLCEIENETAEHVLQCRRDEDRKHQREKHQR